MTNEVKARENGPYLIEGTAVYTDSDGKEQTTQGTTIALCRCGHSGNKPFCDGTHRKIDFQAPAALLKLAD
ncbi:MAG: CDGSH iron-sulfur domain-containing protein [Ardenticatenaceae bacterium]|nr:CDGSH iron-sulfur domain-containing protein [Ardenticatenaceae bacterium]